MNSPTAIAIAALSCFAALPALAAHGPDVRIQGNHKKTLIAGEKGAYHLVEKGSRLTATVKGPTDVTVLLHGTTSSAAAGLFLDKKKIHFVDLKGAGGAKLSTGGDAGPLKTEQISIPAGTHEIGVEAFVGGAAVSFRVAHAAGGAGVVAVGKHRHRGAAALAVAPLAAEPIAAPPADVAPPEAAPLTPPPAVATPSPPAAPPPADDNAMMMGEPPAKPQPDAAAPPANPPPEAVVPAPAAATSSTSVTVETDNKENKRSSATYWLAGTFVLLAGGAVTAWALSSSQNSSYQSASETTPNRGSMLSTANTELTVAEALAGGAVVALAVSAILAW